VCQVDLQLFLMSVGLLWVAIVLVLLHRAIHDAPGIIETESVFIALSLAGLASQFRAVRTGARVSMAIAAMLFAFAAATRTAGTIFLLLVIRHQATAFRNADGWGSATTTCKRPRSPRSC